MFLFLESNPKGRERLLGIVHKMKINLEGGVGVMLVHQQTKSEALQFESRQKLCAVKGGKPVPGAKR